MYAILKTGGKQYKVQTNDVIRVEKLDIKHGETVDIGDVLFVDDGKAPKIGKPLLTDVRVKVKVLKHTRNDKVVVFKKKRRNNYRRKKGHRQHTTFLQVVDIVTNGT